MFCLPPVENEMPQVERKRFLYFIVFSSFLYTYKKSTSKIRNRNISPVNSNITHIFTIKGFVILSSELENVSSCMLVGKVRVDFKYCALKVRVAIVKFAIVKFFVES